MTRKDFIESDEYITTFLRCAVIYGRSVKAMRKEIAEHWIQHRDELLNKIEWDEKDRHWIKYKKNPKG